MSRYTPQPLDLSALKTVALEERGGKVKVADFAAPYQRGAGIAGLLDSLPHLLAAESSERGKHVVLVIGRSPPPRRGRARGHPLPV